MLHELNESELVREAIAGDRASLSQLLLLHYDELHAYVAQRISEELRAVLLPEDVLQETFFRAANAIRTFENRHYGSICAWLKTIAGNLIKDAQKRRRRERRSPNPTYRTDGDMSSLNVLIQAIGTESASPSRIVRHEDNVARLRTALARLPADQREVIQRYYLRDESLDEISQAMERSKGAIRGICYRARQNLRLILGHSSQFFSR